MEHGEVISRRVDVQRQAVDFQTSDGVQKRLVMVAKEETVTERWCERCGKVVQARGVVGALLCPECHATWDKKYWE